MSFCLNALCTPKYPLIPFRIRRTEGNRRIGIAAKTLDDLFVKVRKKFELPKNQTFSLVCEEDGTEVDDDEYLHTLPNNAVLVLVLKGEQWKGAASLLDSALFTLLRATHLPDAGEKVRAFISKSCHEDGQYQNLLGGIASNLNMNVKGERREEDTAWFTDVPAKYKTKCAFMREKARARVRGYLYHTKDFVAKQALKNRTKKTLEEIVDDFLFRLKEKDNFGDYFDRCSPYGDLRFCDDAGWFKCEGAFDVHTCSSVNHHINPYGSREQRILFSTWDLDHGIEKSRTILPCLKDAASNLKKEVNVAYFFELLFTRQNLKLVHPVCHDKTGHTGALCDPSKIYIQS